MEGNEKIDLIYGDLIKSIETGKLKIGEKLLPERRLAEEYNASRATIREALNYLKALGYIYSVNKIGNFVTDDYLSMDSSNLEEKIKAAPIEDLMELRLILEKEIVRLAVERADSDDVRDMKKLVADMVLLKENPYGFYILDLKFHGALAKATKNLIIINLMDYLLEIVKKHKETFIESGEKTYREDIKIFNGIISAIEDKDVSRAIELQEDHLLSVHKFISESK